MNALGASILAVVLCVVLFASRRWSVIGMMAGVLYLTQGQHLDIFGFNMFAVRFVELAGFIRVVARRELTFAKLSPIDKALLLLLAYSTIIYVVRSNENQKTFIGST